MVYKGLIYHYAYYAERPGKRYRRLGRGHGPLCSPPIGIGGARALCFPSRFAGEKGRAQ